MSFEHISAPMGRVIENARKQMAYEQRPNTGTLFRVPEEKRTTETSKDYDGEFLIKCPHCQGEVRGFLNGWIKTAKATGKKFLSVAFKLREARQERQPDRVPDQKLAAPAARPRYGEDDREIPF